MEDRTQLVAKEGPAYIQYVLGSGSTTQYAKLGIDERWITQFINYNNLSYLGEGGIRISELYKDNGESIFTHASSWKLSKESTYISFNNRTIILAKITPNSVKIDRASNKSSLYYLDMESVGALTRIDLMSSRPSDEKVSDVSDESVSRNVQDYAGHVKTELMVSYQWVTTYPTNETYANGEITSVIVTIVE